MKKHNIYTDLSVFNKKLIKLWKFEQLIKWVLHILLSLSIATVLSLGIFLFIKSFLLGGLSLIFLFFSIFVIKRPNRKIFPSTHALNLSWEVTYPREHEAIWQNPHKQDASKLIYKNHLKKLKNKILLRLLRRFFYLLLGLTALCIVWISYSWEFRSYFQEIAPKKWFPQPVILLTIESGLISPAGIKNYRLNEKNTIPSIKLSANNLLKITVQDSLLPAIKTLELHLVPVASAPLSSFSRKKRKFRLLTHQDLEKQRSLKLTISEDSKLFIPHYTSTPLLEVTITRLNPPKVTLLTKVKLDENWKDDQPLPLTLLVESKISLHKIFLEIHHDQTLSRELVANFMLPDTRKFQKAYSLLLEPHIHRDRDEIHITAVAVDNSQPINLVGRSQTIILHTSSAYGRYQKALESLKLLKSHLDATWTKSKMLLRKDLEKNMNQIQKQVGETPFFDVHDRLKIHHLIQDIKTFLLTNKYLPSSQEIFILIKTLNQFLSEHEMLDNLQRDRDFFVALRALSQVLADKQKSNDHLSQQEEKRFYQHLENFLDERTTRWEQRIRPIPEIRRPKNYQTILEEKPFHKSLISILSPSQDVSQQQENISDLVRDYRHWIESLEKAEEQQRQVLERKKQKSFTSAQNTLLDLRRRQDNISSYLDKSTNKSPKTLLENWPVIYMKQNTNIKDIQLLIQKIQSLLPKSALRLTAALERMKNVTNFIKKEKFVLAETSSDQASRLLRQAESQARKERRNASQHNKRRRRRLNGDHYYGRALFGGDIDIKHDYKVDKRYREDILNDVLLFHQEGDDESLLKSYLRRMIR